MKARLVLSFCISQNGRRTQLIGANAGGIAGTVIICLVVVAVIVAVIALVVLAVYKYRTRSTKSSADSEGFLPVTANGHLHGIGHVWQ